MHTHETHTHTRVLLSRTALRMEREGGEQERKLTENENRSFLLSRAFPQHTHAHTCTHTNTHAHTQTHTRTHAVACIFHNALRHCFSSVRKKVALSLLSASGTRRRTATKPTASQPCVQRLTHRHTHKDRESGGERERERRRRERERQLRRNDRLARAEGTPTVFVQKFPTNCTAFSRAEGASRLHAQTAAPASVARESLNGGGGGSRRRWRRRGGRRRRENSRGMCVR